MPDTTPLSLRFPEWALLPDLGLYMDQVVTLMDRAFAEPLPGGELTRSMVNNYVKAGLLPRPNGKKYDREHLARLLMILVLKQALSMDVVARLVEQLCREGTQAGYARFAQIVTELETALDAGQLAALSLPEEAQEQALLTGIAAAVCTIRTRRLLNA